MSDTNAPRTITDFVLAESEIESLRQQLADHLKREVMLRNSAQALINRLETPLWKDAEPTMTVINTLKEALAATDDLKEQGK